MRGIVIIFLLLGTSVFAQKSDNKIENQVVDASCGLCNFGMDAKGCELAVKIDGKSYLVEGTGIHDHGDAHGKHGFCSAIRKAKVSGEIKKGHFHASSFELLPVEKEEK